MVKVVLRVPDISCEHCERAISETLTHQTGIASVRVDIPGKEVYLEYDDKQIDLGRIGALLDDEGYPVDSTVPA